MRALGRSFRSNSVHLGIDGENAVADVHLNIGGFEWSLAGVTEVSEAGVHTLRIWAREAGTIVDRIVVKEKDRGPDVTPMPLRDFFRETFAAPGDRHCYLLEQPVLEWGNLA